MRIKGKMPRMKSRPLTTAVHVPATSTSRIARSSSAHPLRNLKSFAHPKKRA